MKSIARSLTRYAFLIFWVALLPLPPAAAKVPLMENFQIGFDQNYHAGVWTPVNVTLENRLLPGESAENFEDFEGALEVKVSSRNNTNYVFSRQVVLPRNSRKNFTLYARFAYEPSQAAGRIILRNKQGIVLLDESLQGNALLPEMPLIVIATRDMSEVKIPQRFGLRQSGRSFVEMRRLPDKWYGYQGVGVLVIPHLKENPLSKEQESAILKWVESGGRVLVLGGAEAISYSDSFLESEFGFRFLTPEVRDLPLSPYEGYTENSSENVIQASIAPIVPGGNRVLLRSGPLVLAARAERGLGFVDAWAFGLEDLRLARAPIVRMLWETPIGHAHPPHKVNLYGNYMSRYARSFKADEGQKVPSIALIILILILYLIAVAGNFFYLARRKKLELAWFTLPVIIVGFSLGIYGIGVVTKGSQLIFRHYNIVDCHLGQSSGRLNGVVSLWSPNKRRYAIDPGSEDAVVLDQDRWYPSNFGLYDYLVNPYSAEDILAAANLYQVGGNNRIAFSPDGMRITSKEMSQWDLSYLSVQEPFDLGDGFDGELSWRPADSGGNHIKGRLKNNTPYRMEDVFLVMTGGSSQLGFSDSAPVRGTRLENWQPGEELVIDPQIYSDERWSPLDQIESAMDLLQGGSPDQQFRRSLLRSMLQSRFEQADATRQRKMQNAIFRQDYSTAYLVGWCVRPIERINLSMTPTIEESYSLFVIDLSPSDYGSTYRFSSQGMRPVLSDFPSEGVYPPQYQGDYYTLRDSYFYMSLHAPFQSAPLEPGDMTLSWWFGPDQRSEFQISMFNYRTGRFDAEDNWSVEVRQLSAKQRKVELPAYVAENYVNPFSGEVLFRIESARKNEDGRSYIDGNQFRNLDLSMSITPSEVTL